MRRLLAPDLAGTTVQVRVDPTLEGCEARDSILTATGNRRGYLGWEADHAGWIVSLHAPEEQSFDGHTLEEALA